MRIRSVFPALFVPALLGFEGCAPAPEGDPGNGILVITIDALRYDHLGSSGYDRQVSPALDLLAKEGVVFRQAYSAATWQVPAHMALLSASDPRLARRYLPPDATVAQATQWHLPDEAPHPAAQFLSEGFSTAMFYDHENLAPVYGLQRGFALYQGPELADDGVTLKQGSEEVFRRFDKWLTGIPREQTWFAYLEIADLERVWRTDNPPRDTQFSPRPELSRVPPVGDAPHVYFAVPRSRWSTGMRTLGEYEARYDGAIEQLDNAFDKLRGRLEDLNRFKFTTVVIVGAYGMSFGESGMLLDSGTFSDCDLHVPLIVRPADGLQVDQQPVLRGATSEALVSTVDVLPMLLDLAGLKRGETVDSMDGRSFAGALTGGPGGPRKYVYSSCAYQEGFAVLDARYCFERSWPALTQDSRLSASWFGDSEKRIDVVREVLHDRSKHPELGHVLSRIDEPEIAKQMGIDGKRIWDKIEARRAKLQGHVSAPSSAQPDSRDER